MSNIERAKKLLDAGALTTEEFEQEKARLLRNGGMVDTPEEAGATGSNPRRTIAVAVAAVIGLLVSGWIWLNTGHGESTADSAFVLPTLAEPSSDPEQVIAQATETAPADLTDTLQFADAAQCKAGRALEQAFAKLDKARENASTSDSITVDGIPDALQVAVSNETTATGDVDQSSEIRFDQATWNGLRLSRIRTHLYAPPESDSSYSRIFTFREEPSSVKRALDMAGFNAPMSPSYSELSDDACGGSMYLEAVPGGTALTCSWGC